MEFPRTEPTIVALATTLKNGLPSDPIFANPPVTPVQLATAEAEFGTASSFADQKKAESEEATRVKSSKFETMTGLMKTVLDWALKIPNITEAQLKKIGWGFAAAPVKTQRPAQCGNFRLHSIEGTKLVFDWDKPSYKDGGKPTGFKLLRRAAGSLAAYQLEDAIFGMNTLEDEETDFPSGTWDVVVCAVNSEGDGPISNSVTVTVG